AVAATGRLEVGRAAVGEKLESDRGTEDVAKTESPASFDDVDADLGARHSVVLEARPDAEHELIARPLVERNAYLETGEDERTAKRRVRARVAHACVANLGDERERGSPRVADGRPERVAEVAGPTFAAHEVARQHDERAEEPAGAIAKRRAVRRIGDFLLGRIV